MRIPDYKKRAAQAAAEWLRLQAEKNSNSKKVKEKLFEENNTEEENAIEMSITELIDELTVPKTTVKGIQVVKKELRDTA